MQRVCSAASVPARRNYKLTSAHRLCPDQCDVLQMGPQDEGLSNEPECTIYCYSWASQAPAPGTPSRHEAGASLPLSSNSDCTHPKVSLDCTKKCA